MPTQLHPYLSFAGNCAEAVDFYNQAIADGAGTLRIRPHAEAPADMQPDPAWRDKVLHAHFEFEELVLFASDIPPSHRVDPNPMVNLSLHLNAPERADKVFNALGDGGNVFMPMQETFWAERFGMLRGRYGFSWMITL